MALVTAFSMSWERPFCLSIRIVRAASVVPPGDVTFSRRVAAGISGFCFAKAELPIMVWRASFSERSLGRPWAIDACVRDSIMWNRYAGPEPDTAVTASS